MFWISYTGSRPIDLGENTSNNGTGYGDSMRRADAETNERETAIELSLWKKPPFSTLGNGLPHQTQLFHDHVSLGSPEPSRLQRLPDEILLMISSWLSSKGDRECVLAFFALRQVSRRFRRLMHGVEFCCQWCSDGYEDWLKPEGSPWRGQMEEACPKIGSMPSTQALISIMATLVSLKLVVIRAVAITAARE
ncbi:hypothetical protein IWW34DRAFT_835354 [Fusarium oxysporum f. sp. albedinis]|nr:hypothetical protein IWW34DRAFT_835354 [Fusarium oxysporum f. sp. albedinis]